MHGTTDEVTVRAFEPRDAFAFRTLTLAWIARADVFMRCSLTAAAAPVTSTADIA